MTNHGDNWETWGTTSDATLAAQSVRRPAGLRHRFILPPFSLGSFRVRRKVSSDAAFLNLLRMRYIAFLFSPMEKSRTVAFQSERDFMSKGRIGAMVARVSDEPAPVQG